MFLELAFHGSPYCGGKFAKKIKHYHYNFIYCFFFRFPRLFIMRVYYLDLILNLKSCKEVGFNKSILCKYVHSPWQRKTNYITVFLPCFESFYPNTFPLWHRFWRFLDVFSNFHFISVSLICWPILMNSFSLYKSTCKHFRAIHHPKRLFPHIWTL